MVEWRVAIRLGDDEREDGSVAQCVEPAQQFGLFADDGLGFFLDAIVAYVQQPDGMSLSVDGLDAEWPVEVQIVDPPGHFVAVKSILAAYPVDGFAAVGRGHSA